MLKNQSPLKVKIYNKSSINVKVEQNKVYPPLEDLEVTPTKEKQNFKSTKYGYNEVVVNAIPEEYIIPEGENTIIENGKYDVSKIKIANVEVELKLEEQKVEPKTEAQTIIPSSGYNGFSKVIISEVTSKIDNNIQKENIKFGKEILGVVGDVEELQGEEKEVTPTKLIQEILPSEGKNGLTKVTVHKIPDEYVIPNGKVDITANGTYDIREKEEAIVLVQPNLQDKKITQNGEYTADEGYDGLKKVTVETSGVDINDYFITEGLTSSKYKIPALIKKLPPIDISGVTNIDSMFSSMESISFITPMDTSAVTSMMNCFSTCKLLANFPITTMENVTNASGAFGACAKLLDVGELNLLSATSVASMFVNSGVANISMINTSKITNIEYIFQRCKNLKNVPISDFSNVQYAQSAFESSGIETVPNINMPKVTNLDSFCYACADLTTIGTITVTQKCSFTRAFAECKKLTTVGGINGKVKSADEIFSGCILLEDIPEFDCSEATRLYNTFSRCSSLSDESLNNILNICRKSKVTSTSYKTLKIVGLTSAQATTCQDLSNYQAFLDAGWTTGY